MRLNYSTSSSASKLPEHLCDTVPLLSNFCFVFLWIELLLQLFVPDVIDLTRSCCCSGGTVHSVAVTLVVVVMVMIVVAVVLSISILTSGIAVYCHCNFKKNDHPLCCTNKHHQPILHHIPLSRFVSRANMCSNEKFSCVHLLLMPHTDSNFISMGDLVHFCSAQTVHQFCLVTKAQQSGMQQSTTAVN